MNPFIVLEALDAGGSQTQTDLLAKRLAKSGYHVTKLHFPQEHRATGQVIYNKFLLAKNKLNFSRREQALLYILDFFSRAEELWAIIQGKKKQVLLTDRFYTSTMAYQTIGLAGPQRRAMLNFINYLCEQNEPRLPKPNKVTLIDTPVDISLKRLTGKAKDFFENRQKLTAIRNSYLKLAKEQKWVVINGADKKDNQRTREEIHEEIWRKIQGVLR